MKLRRLLLRYYPPGGEARTVHCPVQGPCRLGGAGARRGDRRWAAAPVREARGVCGGVVVVMVVGVSCNGRFPHLCHGLGQK